MKKFKITIRTGIFITVALVSVACAGIKIARAALFVRPANNTGLVLWWTLDENGGTVAHDLSGSGNTGTIYSSTWTNGKFGKALDMPGSGDPRVASADTNSLDFGTGSFTVSMWGYYRDFTYPKAWFMAGKANDGGCYNGAGGTTGGWEFGHGYYATGINVCFADNTSGTNDSVDFDVGSRPTDLLNKWANLTIVADRAAGRIKFYVNGVKQTNEYDISAKTGSISSNGGLVVGALHGWQTDAKMDEIRIYNRKLDVAEIVKNYQNGITTRRSVSQNSMAAWWKMDEGTSTKAHDFSGNGITATFTGTPVWENAIRGRGLTFNGGNGLTLGSGLSLGDNDFTIAQWVKTTSSSGQMYTIANAGSGNGYRFGLGGGVVAFLIGNNSSYTESTCTTATVNDGKWHHIAGVFVRSANVIRCYIDGVEKGTAGIAAYSGMLDSAPGLGSAAACCTGFNGTMDDVRVYRRALTANEIARIYAENKTVLGKSQEYSVGGGLVAYWPFNGRDIDWNANKAWDRSASIVNGNLINMNQKTSPVPGKVGQALSFDGVDDSVDLVSTINLGNNNWTASAWVKTSTGGDLYILTNQSGGPVETALRISSGKINFYHYDGAWQSESGSITVNDGKWHHLAWVNSSNQTIKMYVDGVLDVNGVASTVTGTGPVNRIGRQWDSGAVFIGSLDEMRIYNKQLTASDIKQLYLLGK